jgi:DNA-damage-inducible protein J
MTVGNDNIVTSPKNAVFQIRLNQEVKSAAEDLFASCGLTLTDAVNLFIQQSLNVGGLPFEVRAPGAKLSKEKALEILLEKLETTDSKFEPSAKS